MILLIHYIHLEIYDAKGVYNLVREP